MSVKLLTEHNLEILSLTGRCTGSSESTLVKMPLLGNHVSISIPYPCTYLHRIIHQSTKALMQLFQKCHLFPTGTPKQHDNYNNNRNVMSVSGSVVVLSDKIHCCMTLI